MIPYLAWWQLIEVWLVVLMHTMEDALNPLISEGFAVVSPDKTLLVSPTFGLIPLLIYLAIGLYLRKIRINNKRLKISKL